MAFHYKSVVPWGRSFEEYVRMFGLKEADLKKKILGCGDGPASFNSMMARMGYQAVSIDPIYQMSVRDIEKRIRETYAVVIGQTYSNRNKFIWKDIPSVEELGKIRMDAMRSFLEDFEKGKMEKRYIDAELPVLPVRDREFDIALSSHFLFLYTDNLSLDFHIESVREMCRVAKEARIFPLLDVNGNLSLYVEEVKMVIMKEGKSVSIEKVDYEFQKGGNQMMVIKGEAA